MTHIFLCFFYVKIYMKGWRISFQNTYKMFLTHCTVTEQTAILHCFTIKF